MKDKPTLYDYPEFYDLVHGELTPMETLDFYQKQIVLYGSPVLELACGTGHYLIPLVEQGVEVVGLDISDEMLGRAREKAVQRGVSLDVRSGDMRDFELNRKFSLILLLGNSLQHLLTREEIESCFASVKRHLQPGGRFIVEVFNPSLKILSRDKDEMVLDSEYETEEGKMILTGSVNYDKATQINHITWNYRNEATQEVKTMAFAMRQFFPQELDALLVYNGFQIEKKFGSREGSDFNSESLRQIVVASQI